MLKQTIQGLRPLSVDVVGSDGDKQKLADIMAGKVEKYKSVGDGGVAINAIPNPLNKKVFVVGDRDANGRMSTMFTLPHVKTASEYPEMVADIKGKFDSSYTEAIKCEYVTLKFDK
ncbi:hypothetical protein [Campylobacter sp. RM16187]|uniref:hypothetical protein n=1 Tax=Campylobacter sp. RM16187 TaxID=1660063 RepID=UPI0021B5C926|nr:hypothetical protein [Campylobacter sp. RM16187]QKG28766.1 hypothetical protein CDOMF_0484 [Campylobacter sp. RM16187]